MMPAGPAILGTLLWFVAVVVVIINPGGIRKRLMPYNDRFIERLPPPARLVFFVLLITLGAGWVAMAISFDGFWSFVQTPLGQVCGYLWWVGIIIVLVGYLATRKQ